ncbi:MAG: hypothetical protein ACLT2V_13900 [Escherichia coli]
MELSAHAQLPRWYRAEDYPLSSNEKLWVRNQNDPVEARAQLITCARAFASLRRASDDAAAAAPGLTSARHPGHAGSALRRGGCAHLVHRGDPAIER